MSGSSSANPLVMEPDTVFELALRSEGWSAARSNDGQVYRLAGATVDVRAFYVTEVLLVPGIVSVETIIPVYLPADRRDEAVRLCSVLHASAGVFSLGASGAPMLLSKTMLLRPESYAASVIVDAVRRDRELAYWAGAPFYDVAQGGSAAAAASKLHLGECVPAANPIPTAAQLELSRTPQPSRTQLVKARALQVSDLEAVSLARNQALVDSIANAHPDEPPFCAGPLIFHQDGVVECHYCDSPETRIHGRGCTASCRPQRRLGKGHDCPRCTAEPAS